MPVVDQALKRAGVVPDEISAVAYTRGPGLLGSLLVGTSFAKGFAVAAGIPLIEVNHLEAHVMAHFIRDEKNSRTPSFPFLCLLVSGGHTQLMVMHSHYEMEVIGNTIDDAAGEAFDKCGKVMGMPYPSGPLIDKLAGEGNPQAFQFSKPSVKGLDFSFSGLKTNFLYFLRDHIAEDKNFIEKNLNNLCASLQHTIINILTAKLVKAAVQTGVKVIGIAGGVSANSGLRGAVTKEASGRGWDLFIPPFSLTTDNAAMIGVSGYYKYLNNDFSGHDVAPLARFDIKKHNG